MYLCMYVHYKLFQSDLWSLSCMYVLLLYVCVVGEPDSDEQEAEGGRVLPAAHEQGRQPQQAATAVRGHGQAAQQRSDSV